MITRNDCLLLLNDLEEKGIDVSKQIEKTIKTNSIDIDVLKFINEHRQLDVLAFYEKLRKSYNDKKSKLYINIVKEITDPYEVLVTLSSLNLQILLFSKHLDDKESFLQHSRFDEINKCLLLYSKNYDITNCIKLLKLVKADLKSLESIK